MQRLEDLSVTELVRLYKKLESHAPERFTFHNANHGAGVIRATAHEKLESGNATEKRAAEGVLGLGNLEAQAKPKRSTKVKVAAKKSAHVG